MRVVMMVGVMLLAGCGLSPEWNEWREKRIGAAQERERAAEWQRIAQRNSPSGKAEENCQTKVAFAMAANPIRGSLDVAGVVRQQQLQAQCMDYWRRTGQMP